MEKQFLSKSRTEFRQIWKWYSQGNRPQLKAWTFNVLFIKGMKTPFCLFHWYFLVLLATATTIGTANHLQKKRMLISGTSGEDHWYLQMSGDNFIVENSNQIENGGRQSVSGQRRDHEIAQLHSEHLLLMSKLQDFAFRLRVEQLGVEGFHLPVC